jgi:hypothetical protein
VSGEALEDGAAVPDGAPSHEGEATEPSTAHFDPERAQATTRCPAPGQLESTDEALYDCFTCTDHCSDIGSWSYTKNRQHLHRRRQVLRLLTGGAVNGPFTAVVATLTTQALDERS